MGNIPMLANTRRVHTPAKFRIAIRVTTAENAVRRRQPTFFPAFFRPLQSSFLWTTFSMLIGWQADLRHGLFVSAWITDRSEGCDTCLTSSIPVGSLN
jgi:hypothetical protein